jgi:Flp pilus assembly protein TadD
VAAWASACAAPPSADSAPDRVGAAAAYARAKVAWTEGARELAVGWYVRAVGLDPESAELRAELGHALMITGDFARARDELAHARRLDVAGCAGAVDLAQLDLREQRAQSAAETLLEVVREEPGEARALQLLHPLLLYLGRADDGLEVYTRAVERRPDLAFVHEARADFLAEVGRNEEAIAGYRRALALDPRRYAAERKAVRLLEQESERLLRKLAIPADPRVGLPAAKGAAVGSG